METGPSTGSIRLMRSSIRMRDRGAAADHEDMANRGELLLDCGRIPWRRDLLPLVAVYAVVAAGMIAATFAIAPRYAGMAIAMLIVCPFFLAVPILFMRRNVRVWEAGLESSGGFHRWQELVMVELYGGEFMSVVTRQSLGRWPQGDSVVETRVPPDRYDELGALLVEQLGDRARVRRA